MASSRTCRCSTPLLDPETQTRGRLARAGFSFDRKRDVYVRPASHDPRTTGHVVPGGLKQYRARPCVLRPMLPEAELHYRSRPHGHPAAVHEDRREHVRQLAGTTAFKASACKRRKVEMPVAHLRRNLGLEPLGRRGLTGASDEFPLAATAQNLRRLARTLLAPSPPDALAPA